MKNLIIWIVCILCSKMAIAEAVDLEWPELIDQAAQDYEDPYLDLNSKELQDLVSIVRLRVRLEAEDLEQAERSEIAARLAALEAEFLKSEIDIDWLIDQRWVVAERRENAAWAGNSSLDGAEVTLGGFAIPAPPGEDGAPTAYLVPERGMCSHMPPPPPNQMVRVRLPDGWTPTSIYEPMRVTGVLSVVRSERQIMVVDGMVPMRASFSMDVSEVQSFRSTQTSEDATNAWVEQMAQRLRNTTGQVSNDK